MLVRFLREERVLDGDKRVVQHFLAGQVVELSTASAQRWIRREAAVKANGSVPSLPSRAEVMPEAVKVVETKRAPDPFAGFRQAQGVEPKPAVTETPKEEPAKRRPGRPRKATAGPSRAAGKAKPSQSSPEAPASPETTSTTSGGDAGSSSSTTPIDSLPGQTSSTPATQAGGESTKTPQDSED